MRPALGPLRFDPAALPAQEHALGDFLLRWEPGGGGRLSVAHRADPARELWASLPGRAFLAAAVGRARVRETSGHFRVRDRLGLALDAQRIDRIAPPGPPAQAALTIRGALLGPGRACAYALSFHARGPRRLGFALSLEDPRLNRSYLSYARDPGEGFFGFGAQYSRFDMAGRRLPIIASEQGVGRGAQPITLAAELQAGAGGSWHSSYAAVPHYLTSQMRSLYLESHEYCVFDLRHPGLARVELHGPELRGSILAGASPAELIGAYAAAVGPMRPLPDWVHAGAILGLQGGEARVRELLARVEAAGAPVAGLWLQDWAGQRQTSFGSQLWWNWALDGRRYPGWAALREELAARGIRLLAYVNPLLAADRPPGAERHLFAEAEAGGFLVRDQRGGPYLLNYTGFDFAMVDLSNPAAVEWFSAALREELVGRADGWMADFGEGLPLDAALHSGEPAATAHNRYPEQWAALNRALIDADGRGDQRVFFMRAGYRASPGLSTLFWAGDQLVSWDRHDGIKSAVLGQLSAGLSGFSLSHSDIGGYTTISHPLLRHHRSKELLLRWIELAAFGLVFRSHEGNRPAANAQVYDDAETLAHFSRFARVHRAWLAYRRELVAEAAATGLPVLRHLWVHHPDDPQVRRLTYQQYLLGRDLLVAPVLDRGARAVRAYLPAGPWAHLWSGATYDGGHGRWVRVAAPLGRPGVFYRPGSSAGDELVGNLKREGLL